MIRAGIPLRPGSAVTSKVFGVDEATALAVLPDGDARGLLQPQAPELGTTSGT
jgi:hypothetical protein